LDASTNAKGAAVTDLYLIAHKVRGEPAFDIAQHMTCPKCDGNGDDALYCSACDGVGHWWIIPTSGHRAYPYWACQLIMDKNQTIAGNELAANHPWISFQDDLAIPEMPSSLRDHYTAEREIATDLIKVLGLIHKPLAPAAPIKRRF
jgi:hypothetical protein